CGDRILKAFANSLDPDETPQNVAVISSIGEFELLTFVAVNSSEPMQDRRQDKSNGSAS
ncbi:hypothetical protein DPMN_026595, partial [Dreissena polymorpha]